MSTAVLFAGLVGLYYYVADVVKLNPYLFPSTEKIGKAFVMNKDVMITNMFASFELLIPSVWVSLVIVMQIFEKIKEHILKWTID